MMSLREIKTDFQNNHITICILLRESKKKRVHQILFSVTRVAVNVKILAFRSGLSRNKYQCESDTHI